MNVVGVQFLPATPLIDCEIAGEENPQLHDRVVVKCVDGIKFGKVLRETRAIDATPSYDLPRIVRIADGTDIEKGDKMAERGREALVDARKMVLAENIPISIKGVEYYFDGSRIVFYFIAEDRIDFRDFVRKLSRVFHRRIELRQTGAREAAGFAGGLGTCGLKLCCGNWLRDFEPVSIRTAKMQCLNVGSDSLTGQCGRLKCCVNYEAPVYQEMMKDLPDIGRWVRVQEGVGKVVELDVLRRIVQVRLNPETVLTLPHTQILEIIKGGPGKDVIDAYKGIFAHDDQAQAPEPRRRPPPRPQQAKNLRDLATEYDAKSGGTDGQAGGDGASDFSGEGPDHDHDHDDHEAHEQDHEGPARTDGDRSTSSQPQPGGGGGSGRRRRRRSRGRGRGGQSGGGGGQGGPGSGAGPVN